MVSVGDTLVYNGANWQNSSGDSSGELNDASPPLVFAIDPNNPGVVESWHAFNPLSSSWFVPSGGYALFRLTVQNELQISAWISSPTTATVNGVNIAIFPEQYVPLSTHGFPVGADRVEANYAAGNGTPLMTVAGQSATTPGALQASGCGGGSGTSANVYIEVKIPLDV